MHQKFFREVDNSPLIVFRILFGFLLIAESWGAILTGWVTKTFVTAAYNFPFIFFDWLRPLPGSGMYYYYALMGLLGVFIMIGFKYRINMILFAIMWSATYFMQKTHYNNHYYLMVLLSWLMTIMPANTYASIDAKMNPQLKKLSCPQWCLWVFVVQMTIVYTYASIAKMYPDWVALKPIEIWFRMKSHYYVVGELLQLKWFQYLIAYGGILFDLLIAPALIWNKTRKYAFITAVFFHLFNSAVFQVGVFPYMAISISIFFFHPETIRRIFLPKKDKLESSELSHAVESRFQPVIFYLLLIYFCVQVALPLRHYFYTDKVVWTEEGHRLSWRMMLRIKSGYVKFKIIDPETHKEWIISPNQYLNAKQSYAIASKPDMCWQFVQILKKDFANKGFSNVEIYANGKVGINGRPMTPLYNPEVNLATVEWSHFQHSDWLLPAPF